MKNNELVQLVHQIAINNLWFEERDKWK